MENPMRKIIVEKVTLNIGTGKEQANIDRGIALLTQVTGRTPVKTLTNKRIPAWGLRPGLPIGVKVTVRKKEALELLKRLLDAKDFKLNEKCFDNNGNISFGIHEYIDISGTKYDPKIGMMGLQVSVTLARPGYRVKHRKDKKQKIGKKHKVTKEDAIKFMKETFNLSLEE